MKEINENHNLTITIIRVQSSLAKEGLIILPYLNCLTELEGGTGTDCSNLKLPLCVVYVSVGDTSSPLLSSTYLSNICWC